MFNFLFYSNDGAQDQPKRDEFICGPMGPYAFSDDTKNPLENERLYDIEDSNDNNLQHSHLLSKRRCIDSTILGNAGFNSAYASGSRGKRDMSSVKRLEEENPIGKSKGNGKKQPALKKKAQVKKDSNNKKNNSKAATKSGKSQVNKL